MKIINRHNFFSIVCISFTLIVCAKLIIEKLIGFTDIHYTENIFTSLGFSVLITAVLALQFYLQRFPLIPVLIGQYIAVVLATAGFVTIMDITAGTAENAMRQMIVSVTIPFVISAAIYYIAFFREVRKANKILTEINKAGP